MDNKTDYQLLRGLLKTYLSYEHERGILSAKEISEIKDGLLIEGRDIKSLRNLRNFVVLQLKDWRRGAEEKYGQYSPQAMKYWDELSAITAVIDSELYKLGAEI